MKAQNRERLIVPSDFHSHILPGMDDGSDSVKTTLQMLEESARQGVREIVATPHFYPVREAPDSFLRRRAAAVAELLSGGYDPQIHPKVFIGAEVAYFPGIGRCEDLKNLCVQGTRLVLIEMPFRSWTQTMLDDIVSVRTKMGLIPALAHIDRYAAAREHAVLNRLVEDGVVVQVNNAAVLRTFGCKKALHLLQSGSAQLIGSDSHNCTTRPTRMKQTAERIAKRAGHELLSQLDEFARFMLEGARPIG